jgi:hypothetical protein
MISIECNKRKKCPAVKQLLGDATRNTVGHCEFSFNLVNGKIQHSAYFQIQADSEEERSHRLKCLKKVYGEICTRVFEDIPGRNPIIDWELNSENIMRLNACVEQLHDHSEQIREMFDPEGQFGYFKPNSDQIEVWSRFIYYRFSLVDAGYSAEDMNNNAVAWTEDDIENLSSEENMEGIRHIAEIVKKNKKETGQAS